LQHLRAFAGGPAANLTAQHPKSAWQPPVRGPGDGRNAGQAPARKAFKSIISILPASPRSCLIQPEVNLRWTTCNF